MNPQMMFFVQLAGAVGVGGFIGELYRTATNESINARLFIANFLAGSFLAFLLGSLIFIASENKPLSIIIGALLSYQDEKFLSGIVRRVIHETYREVIKDNDNLKNSGKEDRNGYKKKKDDGESGEES